MARAGQRISAVSSSPSYWARLPPSDAGRHRNFANAISPLPLLHTHFPSTRTEGTAIRLRALLRRDMAVIADRSATADTLSITSCDFWEWAGRLRPRPAAGHGSRRQPFRHADTLSVTSCDFREWAGRLRPVCGDGSHRRQSWTTDALSNSGTWELTCRLCPRLVADVASSPTVPPRQMHCPSGVAIFGNGSLSASAAGAGLV